MRNRTLIQSFANAWAGLAYVARTQRNFRLHTAATIFVVGLGAVLGLPGLELVAVVLTAAAVLASEVFNTAVEGVVDLAVDGYHPLARLAKNAAAGAVLLTSLAAVTVGAVVFGPRLAAIPPSLAAAWHRQPALVLLWSGGVLFWLFWAMFRPSIHRDQE